MFNRTESMSIKEFMNRDCTIKKSQLPNVKKIATTTLLPLMIFTPSIAFAEEPVSDWARGQLYEKVVHAFEPIVGLVQALSYPIGLVVMLGGGLFVMIGNREKGFSLIQQAGIGYLLVQSLPMLMDLLVEIAKSI